MYWHKTHQHTIKLYIGHQCWNKCNKLEVMRRKIIWNCYHVDYVIEQSMVFLAWTIHLFGCEYYWLILQSLWCSKGFLLIWIRTPTRNSSHFSFKTNLWINSWVSLCCLKLNNQLPVGIPEYHRTDNWQTPLQFHNHKGYSLLSQTHRLS